MPAWKLMKELKVRLLINLINTIDNVKTVILIRLFDLISYLINSLIFVKPINDNVYVSISLFAYRHLT